MIGTKCWSAIGGSKGSMVSFDFGGKAKRDTVLKNPHLTPEQRESFGEWRLFTGSSYWTLIADNWLHVDAECRPQQIGERAKVLVGKSVRVAYRHPGTGVLSLLFREGAHLTVYPYPDEDGTSYTLFYKRDVWQQDGSVEKPTDEIRGLR